MISRLSAALLAVVALSPTPHNEVAALPTTTSLQQLQCLFDNAYHEARGEGVAGVLAVTQVVLNRSQRSGKDVCSVVYEPHQFSWTINKAGNKGYTEDTSAILSIVALAANVGDITGGATHYHAKSVKPIWSRKYRNTINIGLHRFYKERKA